MKSKLITTGSYLPEKIVTNDDLAKIVDTSDEWIVARTGIKQRHIAAEGELTSDMATKAAKKALKKSSLSPEDIDLVIVATTTPDRTFPATAVTVQSKLGITQGAAFDIQAVCSGFIYALSIADNFIKSGQVKNAIVIGAEKMSCILNWQDRNTCILFGDGAGAVILQASDGDSGIIGSRLYSNGNYQDILCVNDGVGMSGKAGTITMEGKEVFKHATSKMSDCIKDVLKETNLTLENIDFLVPHQANIRIMEMVAKKLKIPTSKVINTVAGHANTSAASIPLALDYAFCNNVIKNDGSIMALTAMGAGLTWASCLIKT